eukprot:6210639-Pyramimonas_sp.AAC.1
MEFPRPLQRFVAAYNSSSEGSSGCARTRLTPPRTMFRGRTGSPSAGPTGCTRMRLPPPGQRFVVP